MSELKVGDSFPSDVSFQYVPYAGDDVKACGMPVMYNASKEWAGKKVVIVSVPGAFTPGCSASHVPPYIQKLQDLRKAGVDVVAIIAFNDAFVMSAWSKVNGVKNDDILFLADDQTKFAKSIGWLAGMGDRNGRFAMVVDKDGKIVYAEKEKDPRQITVSGVEAVLSKL